MKKIILLVFFIGIVTFTSCSDDPIPKDDTSSETSNYLSRPNENDKPDVHTQIILGEKL